MPQNPAYLSVSRKSFEKDLATWRCFVVGGFKPKDIKCEHGTVAWKVAKFCCNIENFYFEYIGWDWLLPNCTLLFLDTSSGRIENFNGKLAQYQQRDELSLMLSRNWTIEQQFKWLFQRHGVAALIT